MDEAIYSIAFLRWFKACGFFQDDARTELVALGIDPAVVFWMVGLSDLFRNADALEWVYAYEANGSLLYLKSYHEKWKALTNA